MVRMKNRQINTADGGLKIIYEDEWLIIADKPSGLLTVSTGRSGEQTAYSMLTDYVKETSLRSYDSQRIFIVHRLDRDTSGLLVFAKDFQTKTFLQENWENIVESRKYTAILEGNIADDEGWIETWLYENPKSMMVHCYPIQGNDDRNRPPRKEWRYASSHCKTIKRGEIDGKPYTSVEFELETGRKNQIRVHSQWIGHPIAGDKKYGARDNPFGRLALHAKTLSFTHPWTDKLLTFTSPLPKSFKRL